MYSTELKGGRTLAFVSRMCSRSGGLVNDWMKVAEMILGKAEELSRGEQDAIAQVLAIHRRSYVLDPS